jgi:hypothetical protein
MSFPSHPHPSDASSRPNTATPPKPAPQARTPASQPIEDSNNNDEKGNREENQIQSSGSLSSPKKIHQAKTKPIINEKPRWQENVDRCMNETFLPKPVDLSKFLNTVPFRVITDPTLPEALPGMIQCYVSLLDSKFGHEEGVRVFSSLMGQRLSALALV